MLYLSKNDLHKKSNVVRDWTAYYHRQHLQARAEIIKNFYQHPPPEPNSLLSSIPLVALDLETTGLNWEEDSIVSVGLVEFSTRRIRLNTARYWVVRPHTLLHEKSILVHNLTHSDIASAPPVASVLTELLPLLAGKVVVAHHTSIERHFLLNAAHNAFSSEWLFPMIDTLALERTLTSKQQSWWQRLFRPVRLSLQLRDCRARYALPAYRQHHALNDAVACAELFQAQVSRLDDEVTLAELLDE